MEYTFIAITCRWLRVIVTLRVLSIGQIELFKILVLDRNTWNPTTVYKLLVLDRDTWYNLIERKKIEKQHKNVNINVQRTGFPNLYA